MARLLSILWLCAVPLWAAAPSQELAALLAKHLAARGGAEKLAAIRSLRFTGELSFRGALKFGFVQTLSRPGRIREEAELQGLTQVQAWDGASAWQISPFQGRKDPERLSGDDAKGLEQGADFEGPLVNWEAKGHRLDYLGREDVDGTLAHKVQVVLKDGTEKLVFLEPDHFLVIRVLTRMAIRGSVAEFESDYGEYAPVAGVYFPMAIESGAPGAPRTLFTRFAKAEANLPLEADRFTFPAPVQK